jgi:flavorubredoxin
MKAWKLSILALVVGVLMLSQPHAIAKGPEQHPVIQKAIQQLETVRNELQNQAAHDFQGHRENAIKHINQALQELNLALQVDKH